VTAIPPSESYPNGAAEVTCGDTTVIVLNGAPGQTGPVGPQGPGGDAGTPGTVVTTAPATQAECGDLGGVEILLDGVEAGFICNGAPGPAGDAGPAGPPGPPGPLTCVTPYQLNTKTNSCGKVCKNAPKTLTACQPPLSGDWISPDNSCDWPHNGLDTAVCLP
jgi:hypothetical protein